METLYRWKRKKQWLTLRSGGKEHGNKETEERLHQQPDSLSLSLSLGDNMAHLSGAISGFQVIDCHSCPVLGLVKANLGLSVVSSFGAQIKK